MLCSIEKPILAISSVISLLRGFRLLPLQLPEPFLDRSLNACGTAGFGRKSGPDRIDALKQWPRELQGDWDTIFHDQRYMTRALPRQYVHVHEDLIYESVQVCTRICYNAISDGQKGPDSRERQKAPARSLSRCPVRPVHTGSGIGAREKIQSGGRLLPPAVVGVAFEL